VDLPAPDLPAAAKIFDALFTGLAGTDAHPPDSACPPGSPCRPDTGERAED
jgi:hypothetical protein